MIGRAVDVIADIEKVLTELAQPGVRIPMQTITETVVARHKAIEGKDKEWYQQCAYHHIRQKVGHYIRHDRRPPGSEGLLSARSGHPDQMVIEGFAQIRSHYFINETMVSLDIASKEELSDKIIELRHLAGGCSAHADKLERYRNEKFPPEVQEVPK